MIKHILFICLLLGSFISGKCQLIIQGNSSNQLARFAELETLDNSSMECIYRHRTTDPALSERRVAYEILQNGADYSKYWEYGRYQIDSVLAGMNRNKITVIEANRIYSRYPHKTPFHILCHKQKNELQAYGWVFSNGYVYREPMPDFKWKLSQDTTTVCGYLCHSATTTFRGRQWTAWYADIAVSAGPWKFAGLPGLILRVVSADKEHEFTAISIRKAKSPITLEKKSIIQTTREKFNRTEKEYKSAPGQYMAGSQLAPQDMQGKEIRINNKKLFYNPEEKE